MRTTKLYLISLMSLLLCCHASGQNSWINYYKNTTDTVLGASAISPLGNTGYVISGDITMGSANWQNVFLLKTDQNGNTDWIKNYGGANYEAFTKLLVTPSKDIFLIGNTGFYNRSVFIVKSDSNGNIIWSKTYKTSGCPASSATLTQAGHLIVSCRLNTGFILFELDMSGVVLWAKQFATTYQFQVSGTCPALNGGFMVTGYTNINTGGLDDNFFAAEINDAGVIQWSNTYNTYVADYIIPTYDHCYLIAGYNSGFGNTPRVLKISAGGDVRWAKSFYHNSEDMVSSIAATPDSGFLISVTTMSDPNYAYSGTYVIKADSSGLVKWKKAFPAFNTSSSIYDLALGNNNEMIFAGGADVNNIMVGRGSTDGVFCQSVTLSPTSGSVVNAVKSPLTLNLTAFSVTDSLGFQAVNGTFQKSIMCSNVAVPEFTGSEDNINIFPNPANDKIDITIAQKATVEIINSNGQIVRTVNCTEINTSVDITGLANGVYLLRAITDKEIAIKKFIKE